MAFAIIQTFLARLQSCGMLGDLPDLTPVLRQFQVQDKTFEQVEIGIVAEDRPPMLEIPAYREKRCLGD